MTPPRPWGSPPRWRPFPHIRRAAPPTTANGVPLRAPRDLRARPHPPISARQEAPAAPLAAAPVRQTPVPPTSRGQPRSIQLCSLSPRRRRRQRRGGLALCRDSRPLSEGHGAATLGRAGPAAARAYLAPTLLHPNEAPTPHSKAPNSRPRPGVWRQHAAPPREESPAARAGPWRHRAASATRLCGPGVVRPVG